ncbi:hypothetical protein MRB53_032112 [Persea americana]|uniref:Uncharacterized protein n=1 Tax=Persea americana TaxID=3435 RepID=A0ACC2KR81_PERAE|nr:hypothetical protein MRB53_032112 [Persea americana]
MPRHSVSLVNSSINSFCLGLRFSFQSTMASSSSTTTMNQASSLLLTNTTHLISSVSSQQNKSSRYVLLSISNGSTQHAHKQYETLKATNKWSTSKRTCNVFPKLEANMAN